MTSLIALYAMAAETPRKEKEGLAVLKSDIALE